MNDHVYFMDISRSDEYGLDPSRISAWWWDEVIYTINNYYYYFNF